MKSSKTQLIGGWLIICICTLLYGSLRAQSWQTIIEKKSRAQ